MRRTPFPISAWKSPIANIYYLLCYAWDVLEEKETLVEVDALDSTDLLDLFARVRVNGPRRLRRRGLDRGYLPYEDEFPGVRGKLLVTQTLRRALLSYGRTACAWDELEYDTLSNRILKTTLQRLRDAAGLDKDTRADVHDLLRWLAPVQPIDLYQLFTYLRQRAAEPGWEQADGVLLYPRTTRDFAVEFTTHGHRIRALTLDLAQPWKNIHAGLMQVVNDKGIGMTNFDSQVSK